MSKQLTALELSQKSLILQVKTVALLESISELLIRIESKGDSKQKEELKIMFDEILLEKFKDVHEQIGM